MISVIYLCVHTTALQKFFIFKFFQR